MVSTELSGMPASMGVGVTVGALFRDQALLGPARPALEDGDRLWTYAKLNDRVNRLAHFLASRSVGRGDRVAVLSENRLEYVEVMLAAAKLGVLVACQNWRLADAELKHCLTLADPKLVFCSGRFSSAFARIDHGVPSCITFGDDYEHALARADAREPPDVADPEDGLLIIYTSGTTGLPKGAVISQRAEIMRAMLQRIEPVPVTPDDGYIAWPPMFHIGGTDSTLAAMMRGAKVMIMDGFDAERLVAIAARERIAHLSVLPGVVDRVIDALKTSGLRPLSVRTVGLLADLVSPASIAELTSLVGAPYCNSFGSTETGWLPASRALIPVGVAPTRLSKVQSSYGTMRLVDEDDNDVPDGEAGQVICRGPTLFSGYWRAPEVNAREFRGGWFHLGDMLKRNPDGTLDFVDRHKYLIKSGGENIYPAEIERVLIALPEVADVVVVRKPDARWGEVPVAFVVRGPGASLTEAQAIAACRSQIASYKVPKEVRFVSETDLKRSSSGKIVRGDLEALLKREMAPRES
jgi:fatty-acyl-CoA synthase